MWKQGLSMFTIALVGTASIGCAHVPRDQFESEISRLEEQQEQLREDAESGDARLADRLDSVEQDVSTVTARVDTVDQRVEALRADLTTFETEFNAEVERLEGAIAFNVPVHFEYDSDVVRQQDEPVLERFATVVDSYYPDSLITVEGFTDPAGTEAYNIDLGKRRAESVRDYLADHGLTADRIRTVSYGESDERLVLPDAWGEDGLANRRVTLVVETAGADWDVMTDTMDDADAATTADASPEPATADTAEEQTAPTTAESGGSSDQESDSPTEEGSEEGDDS